MFLLEQLKESGINVEEWGARKRIILIAAPTGCGKTTFGQRYLPDICLKHDTKMAIIVNRRVLKLQVDEQNFELMLENCLMESPVRIFTYQQLEKDGFTAENIIMTQTSHLNKCLCTLKIQ